MPVILLIDDDPLFQYLVQRYVERSGCQFCSTASSTNALTIVQQQQPEFILLDLALPPDGGWQVLRQLKADSCTHSIPVAICANAPDQVLAWDEGADFCLPKPLMYHQLVHVLADVGIPVTA